jgi:hypothetical protein
MSMAYFGTPLGLQVDFHKPTIKADWLAASA